MSPEDFGLSPATGFVEFTPDGPQLPGAEVEFRLGVTDGVAGVRRRFALELHAADGLVERTSAAAVGVTPSKPVVLRLRLPRRAPADYELRLVTDPGGPFRSSLQVPAQRLDDVVRVVCLPERARRGERVRVEIHNGGPPLFTGVAFGLERRERDAWVAVDPFDGDENIAWAAIGLGVGHGRVFEDGFEVPRLTHPGPHRFVKWFSAEEAGIGDVPVRGEFEVVE